MGIRGKLIVIEGLDGSGKSTQIELLCKKLDKEGIQCRYIHFPMLNRGRYGELIAEFLRGEYGSLQEVHPKLVALLFANDRKEHVGKINEWLNCGCVVLADRYVNSNIAFQGAKLKTEAEKEKLKQWILDFEFNYNQLPLPYKSFFLDVSFSHIVQSLSNKRTGDDRDYLNGKTDIHESSLTFQKSVYNEYKKMVEEQPDFVAIRC
jgi:dTMP kinase